MFLLDKGKTVYLEAHKSCVAPSLNNEHLLPPPPPGDPLNFQLYAYVDKTDLLARIMAVNATFIFAPSMRRIGKSATVNMLAAMASGQRDMFDGYAVNNPGSSFKIGETNYSVIQLDFSGVIRSTIPLRTIEQQEAAISSTNKKFTFHLIEQAMVQHGIKIEPTFDFDPGNALACWLRALKEKDGRKIVLLIDEYDDPIAQFLPGHPEFAESMVAVMRPFYLAIKKADTYFHKVFITGVSKYSSTSLFSGANMLTKIMEDTADFSTLYGFTEQEIRDTYGPFIENKFKNQSLDEVMDDMRRMYDGYRVHPKQLEKDRFFNPWDVLKYLATGELRSFWTDSCTSSRVLEMLGMHGLKILDGFEIEMDDLFAPIAAKETKKHWQQLAFQTGYATIKNVVPLPDNRFTLTMGVPNQEVREFLGKEFVKYLVGQVGEELDAAYKRSLLELNFTEMEYILEKIIKKFSPKNVPTNEETFKFYLLYAFVGDKRFQSVTAEPGARLVGDKLVGDFSRADAMVAFNKSGVPGGQLQLVVYEVKYNQSAAAALQQMEEKKYAERVKKFYKKKHGILGEVTVHMIGVNMNEDLTVELKHKVWSPQK